MQGKEGGSVLPYLAGFSKGHKTLNLKKIFFRGIFFLLLVLCLVKQASKAKQSKASKQSYMLMKLSIYREVELSLKAACRHLLLASSLTSILLLHLYSRDFPFCSRPLTEKKEEEGGRLLLYSASAMLHSCCRRRGAH